MDEPDLDWWDESFTETERRYILSLAWWMRAFGCDCDSLQMIEIHPPDPQCELYPRRHMSWQHQEDCGYHARRRVAIFN
jgi:hypothetical protein